MGSVYESFLEQFALAEGRKGGEFYTPRSVVRLLVEMLQPYQGRVYDPCCGSSGMFVQSVDFIDAHASGNGNGGRATADISIYGQESNYTTWRMARMNLAIRGIEGQIAHGDSFHNDRHPDLRADYILANPPFNVSDWGGERLPDDQRWRYGVPPKGNANFAWVQHFLHHLAPRGRAGFVLANGSMSSNQSGEGQIRKNIVEARLVDCIVALPGQLFRSTQIPACLWFLSRDRSSAASRDETLFIDARQFGHIIDRTRRDLSADDIARVANTYHAWRNRDSPSSSPSPLKGEGRGEGEDGDDPNPLPLQGGGLGCGGSGSLHRHPRLLQKRQHRRHPQARSRSHAGPLRRRRTARRRRRTLRGEDDPPHQAMARAASRGAAARRGHRGESGEVGLRPVGGAPSAVPWPRAERLVRIGAKSIDSADINRYILGAY